MPTEFMLLQHETEPFAKCPKCGVEPFESFLRGMVQRRKRKWFLFGREWPYCSIICWKCKEIVGHQHPITHEVSHAEK
jgi:hypothetical protein